MKTPRIVTFSFWLAIILSAVGPSWAGQRPAAAGLNPTQPLNDNLPPVSAVDLLPAYTRQSGGFLVSWDGYDPGGSGIAGYHIQYRFGNGSWTDWLTNTTSLSGIFPLGNSGQTLSFRSRATDNAGNVESWPAGADTQTILYRWAARGAVYDNAHTPVVGATATTDPAALAAFPSDLDGLFSAFVSVPSSPPAVYNLSVAKGSYGALPATDFPGIYDANVDMILPPADNIVADGGFESGGLGFPWIPSGGLIVDLALDAAHTGRYHLELGAPPQQWTPPQTMANTTSYPYPELVATADGQVHVLWVNDEGLNYRSRTINGDWSATETIRSAAAVALGPVVLDRQGIVHVAWSTADYRLYYARRNVNGSWSEKEIAAQSYTHIALPRLAVDDQGRVHATWVTAGALFASRRLAAGVWDPPTYVSDSVTDNPWFTSLAVDGDGRVHLAWSYYPPYPMSLSMAYAQSPGDGFWSTPVILFPGPAMPFDDIGPPFITSDGDDGVYLVWERYAASYFGGVYFRQWDEHLGWSDAQRLTVYPSSVLDTTVGDNGAFHVLWWTPGYPVWGLYYARRDARGTWSLYQQVQELSDSVEYVDAALALDAGGSPHIVWKILELSDQSQVFYSHQLPDGSWPEPQELASNDSGFHAPSLVIDTGKLLHTAYFVAGATWPNGAVAYHGPVISASADTAAVSQVVTVPVTMTTPLLSFLYQVGGTYGDASDSTLVVRVDDGSTTTPVVTLDEATGERWAHAWSDLSAWTGQTVTVTFTLEQGGDAPTAWARVDEVSLGAGYPDLWVTLSDGAGLPGEEITLTLTYGNQGGVPAAGVHITQTLPAGLNFVGASLPPISTNPPVWDVGNLPAGSGPFTILLRVQVAPSAPLLTTLTSTVTIAPAGPELETANNADEGQLFVGRRQYLSVIFRS
ncbi:MAG: DUF11 domain-containing protein [Chloroflexi bacterium]|nr:DUF11 domain-containing protein [Chloroflexota bacterium]MCI0649622.1 DUF11 domain-containing protein [Chloroflexota bacterium]MCI0727917.1 DUF11 domain-containing protein [Chloroflexota bacterium]